MLSFTSPPPAKFASGYSSDRGGKTHILCTLRVRVIERGIVLTFIPLLTMLADGMHKFEASIPTWGNEGVYHRDQIFD